MQNRTTGRNYAILGAVQKLLVVHMSLLTVPNTLLVFRLHFKNASFLQWIVIEVY